jgi:hypothetical protein
VVETVDGSTAELEHLQSELALLSDKLGAIDAKRSKASLKLITPREGSIWYINHVYNNICTTTNLYILPEPNHRVYNNIYTSTNLHISCKLTLYACM